MTSYNKEIKIANKIALRMEEKIPEAMQEKKSVSHLKRETVKSTKGMSSSEANKRFLSVMKKIMKEEEIGKNLSSLTVAEVQGLLNKYFAD